MSIVVERVAAALRNAFGQQAEEAAQASGVIVRKRVLTPTALAMIFVLGFLQDANATDEDLAQVAAQCGTPVTPQAIDQRQTPKLALFLEELLPRILKIMVHSEKALAPILERFTEVPIIDSSTVSLPDGQQEEYPGCGGSHGSGKAAMKCQVEFDLRSGALKQMEIESGRSSDNTSSLQHTRRAKKSLRITDLGYFNLEVFAEMEAADEYFLSRLQFGTGVRLPDGEELDLLRWLNAQSGPFVDQPILLGLEKRLPCRLIAWRLPEEQANRRRQKLREEYRRKGKDAPSEERLAWCDWTILVTSVPVELLSPAEAVVLYRARWQIELLFKRWKSQGELAELNGSTEIRQMIRVRSKLLAIVIQHWLLISSAWGNATKSWMKVWNATKSFVGRLLEGLRRPERLLIVLTDLCETIAKTCGRNPRSKPGTFELLNDVDLLDYEIPTVASE
jgi:hypothetical protein